MSRLCCRRRREARVASSGSCAGTAVAVALAARPLPGRRRKWELETWLIQKRIAARAAKATTQAVLQLLQPGASRSCQAVPAPPAWREPLLVLRANRDDIVNASAAALGPPSGDAWRRRLRVRFAPSAGHALEPGVDAGGACVVFARAMRFCFAFAFSLPLCFTSLIRVLGAVPMSLPQA
jgi:hypothetical protein